MEFPFDEEWKDVVGYEGIYKVSNFGRVKNIKTHKFLKIAKTDGIPTVTLSKKENNRTINKYKCRVDRIECVAFLGIGYGFEIPTILHKDGNVLNNKLDNLKYAGAGNPGKIFYLLQVYKLKNKSKILTCSGTVGEIAEYFNISKGVLRKHIAKKQYFAHKDNELYYIVVI